MADKKISQLSNATTPLAGTEVLPIVQSNSTTKVTVANLTAGRAMSALLYRGGLSPNDQGGAYSAPAAGLFLKNNDTAGTNTILARLSDGTYPNSALPTIEFAGFSGGNGYSSAIWSTASGGIVLATANTFGGTYTPNITLANGAAGDATINKGNLVIGTADKGIDFSANAHAAGMTSELLNDYEEGTWTPNQGAGLTVNGTFSSDGTYTKVGRLVSIHGRIGASVSLSASGALCSNLPYSPASNSTGTYLTGAAAAAGVLWAGGSAIYTVSPGISSTTDVWFCLTYQI